VRKRMYTPETDKTQETQEKRGKFIALYQATFGVWPAKGEPYQQDIWFRFVDTVPFGQLERLFTSVQQDRGDDRRKPLLPQFKRAWKGIKPDKPVYTGNREPCGICNDSGIISVMAWTAKRRDGQCVWQWDEDETHKLSSQAAPCKCSEGQVWRRRSIFADYPQKFCDEAFEVARAERQRKNAELAGQFKTPYAPSDGESGAEVSKHHEGENFDERRDRAPGNKEEFEPAEQSAGLVEKVGYKREELPF